MMHPEASYEAAELRALLVHSLNTRSAAFVIARFWGGYTFVEIADEHGLSAERVREVVIKAQRHLRNAFRNRRFEQQRELRTLQRENRDWRADLRAQELARKTAREQYEASRCACGCGLQRPLCTQSRCACGCGAFAPYCQVLDGAGVRRSVREALREAST